MEPASVGSAGSEKAGAKPITDYSDNVADVAFLYAPLACHSRPNGAACGMRVWCLGNARALTRGLLLQTDSFDIGFPAPEADPVLAMDSVIDAWA